MWPTCLHVMIDSSWDQSSLCFQFPFLTGSDVQSQRRRVVVLEEVQAQAILRRELDRLGSASLAVPSSNNIAVAGLRRDATKISLDSRSIAPGSLLVGRAAKLRAAQTARASELVRRGLEILLLGEQENNRTLLSLIVLGDVEVEDRTGGGVDLAVVAGAVNVVGMIRGNGYNQVRRLVSASERGLAG